MVSLANFQWFHHKFDAVVSLYYNFIFVLLILSCSSLFYVFSAAKCFSWILALGEPHVSMFECILQFFLLQGFYKTLCWIKLFPSIWNLFVRILENIDLYLHAVLGGQGCLWDMEDIDCYLWFSDNAFY